MLSPLTLWHNRRDTLLRIVDGRLNDRAQQRREGDALTPLDGPAPYYSVYIPVGMSPGNLRRHNITVEYTTDLPYTAAPAASQAAYWQRNNEQKTAMRIGLDQKNVRGSIRRITPDLLAQLRYQELHSPEPTGIRPYLEIERVFKAQTERRQPAYYEAALHYIPAGAQLRYRVKVYEKSRRATILPEPSEEAQAPSTDRTDGAAGDWYSVYAIAPEFKREHIFACSSGVNVPDINVGYAVRTPASNGGPLEDLVTFRFDFVDVQRAINDFEIAIQPPGESAPEASRLTFAWLNDARQFDLLTRYRKISDDWKLPVLPVVDAQFDYVTLTLPRSELPPGTTITWRSEMIATLNERGLPPADRVRIEPIRLLFMHYANQSLNDYFESPNRSYAPPRTYIQTTMYDPLGTFSSRPNANETGIGDGYRFVFEQHQKNGLPGVFAINGGFLAMLAQDDPEHFDWFTKGILAGDFEPAIGGWAGHRMLYFDTAVNTAALQYGIDLMENLLPGTSRTVHPNSRLYAATCNIDDAIAAARIRKPLERQGNGNALRPGDASASPQSVQFVVIDQSAFRAFTQNEKEEEVRKGLLDSNRALWGGYKHCYIWRQPCPQHPNAAAQCPPGCRSWYWLIIDSKMKDELFSASEDEWRAGKLGWQLRYHFFYGVSEPARSENCLLVYGDDLDKAAGNGWFDGDYNGNESNNAAKFAAALEWIAAHPWLEVVTTADLNPDNRYVGTLYVGDAIDPSIHTDEHDHDGTPKIKPHWSEIHPRPGEAEFSFPQWAEAQRNRLPHDAPKERLGFEYARWFLEWREHLSPWHGRTLGDLDAELAPRVMMKLGQNPGRELHALAQLAYLMALHEAHWSKKPLESHVPERDFEKHGFGDGSQQLPAYRRPEVLEPENFVLALTLQARNAHVFRCAAAWADLCAPNGSKPARIDGTTRKNDGPLVEELRALNGQPQGGPRNGDRDYGLHWDLDVTPNVIHYNDRLLVVMDENGGRITHIFARAADGRPVVVSGNIKAYQFLGDDRQYGGQLPSNGSVFQNTVFVPNHQYVATDVIQSRPTAGQRHNPKTRIETKRSNYRSLRVADGEFADEDWLYPDNFNHYALAAHHAPNAVTWEYPGLAWQVDNLTSEKFDAALKEYRGWLAKSRNGPAVLPKGYQKATHPIFRKTITLDGSRLTISYDGKFKERPLVANEFSLDLYRQLMHNQRQQRCWFARGSAYPLAGDSQSAVSQAQNDQPIVGCELRTVTGELAVTLRLGENCRFSLDTLDAKANRRLHRAFSDCLEIESSEAGGFSYTIEVSTLRENRPETAHPARPQAAR